MINVLKIGGGAGIEYDAVLRDVAQRVQWGEAWIVVHGASAATDALAEQAGCPVQTLTSPGGHTSRYTDRRMIEIYCAAAASVNQQITAQLAAYGVDAAGLAGPDVVRARRKSAIRAIRSGRMVVVRDDQTGAITGVDAAALRALLAEGLTPVIAPVALGEEFEPLNVDGDLVAATIAHALGAETLIILSNVPGLLRDLDDPGSLVSRFDFHQIDAYEPLAQGRMKKKLLAARQADAGRVILGGAGGDHPLAAALDGGGTHIVREVHYA